MTHSAVLFWGGVTALFSGPFYPLYFYRYFSAALFQQPLGLQFAEVVFALLQLNNSGLHGAVVFCTRGIRRDVEEFSTR